MNQELSRHQGKVLKPGLYQPNECLKSKILHFRQNESWKDRFSRKEMAGPTLLRRISTRVSSNNWTSSISRDWNLRLKLLKDWGNRKLYITNKNSKKQKRASLFSKKNSYEKIASFSIRNKQLILWKSKCKN